MTRADRDFQEKDMKFVLAVGYLVSHVLLWAQIVVIALLGSCSHYFSTYKFLTKYVVHLDADSPVLGFFFLFISLL